MSSVSTPTPAGRRRWQHILKRILQGLIGLVALLLFAGAAYEFISERLDAHHFRQQGRSIPLGAKFPNVSLNLDCSGPGAAAPAGHGGTVPTVILDSGLGIPALGWKLVQDEVARFAHVCSYDRAGYGWSSEGPLPRTSLEIAKELHALLAAAGEQGPFVMVGHSFGGFNVRVYTGQYPHDVVGMVLVDASHEDQNKRTPPAMQASLKPPSDAELKLANALHYLGVSRALAGESDAGKLPRQLVRQLRALQQSAKFNTAVIKELQSFAASAEQTRAAGNLGDRPLLVLTAGKAESAVGQDPGVTQKDLDAMQRIWTDELQVSEMHLSTRGRRVIVADSGHLIPFERPDAVTTAIHEVWEAARGRDSNAANVASVDHKQE